MLFDWKILQAFFFWGGLFIHSFVYMHDVHLYLPEKKWDWLLKFSSFHQNLLLSFWIAHYNLNEYQTKQYKKVLFRLASKAKKTKWNKIKKNRIVFFYFEFWQLLFHFFVDSFHFFSGHVKLMFFFFFFGPIDLMCLCNRCCCSFSVIFFYYYSFFYAYILYRTNNSFHQQHLCDFFLLLFVL